MFLYKRKKQLESWNFLEGLPTCHPEVSRWAPAGLRWRAIPEVLCWWFRNLPKQLRLVVEIPSTWWFQPPLKNISQIGSFPQVGVQIKNLWNHHPPILSQGFLYIPGGDRRISEPSTVCFVGCFYSSNKCLSNYMFCQLTCRVNFYRKTVETNTRW